MMIKKIKSLWGTKGMNLSENSVGSTGVFHLIYDKLNHLVIGTLSYDSKKWTFEYSTECKNKLRNNEINLIINFPNRDKKYETEDLWPFFISRIPTLNQPFHFKKVAKNKVDKEDPVALLSLFSERTINNPFRLVLDKNRSNIKKVST